MRTIWMDGLTAAVAGPRGLRRDRFERRVALSAETGPRMLNSSMIVRIRTFLLGAVLMALFTPTAQAAGPVDLTVGYGPAPGDVDLSWVGGEPEYQVYGSTDRDTIRAALFDAFLRAIHQE